jgi:hypothetical protein
MRSLTSLYTFFNTMLNRQYEAYWRAKEYSRLKGQAADELDPQKVQEIKEEAAKHGKAAAMLLVTSVFLPAIIEKMIAGSDPDESWGHWAGTGLVHEVVAGVPIVREFTGMLEGHEPSFGLYTSLGSRVYKIGTDAGKVYKDGVNRHNAGQIVKDGNTLLALSGRSNEFVGNLAKGLIDMRNKEQTPQSAKELERLLLRGDIRKKGPLDWLLFASKARQTK